MTFHAHTCEQEEGRDICHMMASLDIDPCRWIQGLVLSGQGLR